MTRIVLIVLSASVKWQCFYNMYGNLSVSLCVSVSLSRFKPKISTKIGRFLLVVALATSSVVGLSKDKGPGIWASIEFYSIVGPKLMSRVGF